MDTALQPTWPRPVAVKAIRRVTSRRQAVLHALLALALTGFAQAAPQTNADPKVLDVRAFGAKGDGKSLDTDAIQQALTACANAGGGTVRLSRGTYLSRPLKFKGKTTLVLDEGAVLLASAEHRDFMKTPGNWLEAKGNRDFTALLSGEDLSDLVLTGKGTIDGNGSVWWAEAERARRNVSGYTLPRPNLLTLQRCKRVRISGITLQNSPKFHFVPTECEDVLVDGVTILAPEGTPNTDGIDPSNCRNVTITRCLIDVGDDNIALKSGRKVEGREFGCEQVIVSDCFFKHGHGMSIGSETVGGIRRLVVTNCTFEDTDNGLRIKSRRGRGGRVEDITYSDCTLKDCHPAISIMCYYQDSTHGTFPRNDPPQPVTDTTPAFRNITIRNVTGTSTRELGLIVGLPESPVENIVLENVSLDGKAGLVIANAKGVQLKNVKVTPARGEPYLLHNASVAGLPSPARKEQGP